MRENSAPRRSRAIILLVVVIGVVIAANLLSRLALGVFVHDQAEQVVYSQDWRLAYDEQMPVYQWTMNLLLRLTDYWVLTPDLLKYVWLIVAAVSLHKLGRKMTGRTTGGALAVLFGFLIPTMNEDMLREYSHSAALLALTAASTLSFIGEGKARPVFPAVRPGLAGIWALALLIRHAMAMFIVTQVAAWWAVYRPTKAEMMPVLKTAFLSIVPAIPVLIILLVNMAIVTEGTEEFLGEGSPFDRLRGLGDLASSVLAEGLLLFLVMAVAYLLARRKAATLFDLNTRYIVAVNIIMVGIFLLAVLVTNAAVVRDRWLSPGLVLLGPVAARWMILGLSARTARILVVSLSVFLAIVGVERALEPLLNRWSGKTEDENLPLRAIALEVSAKAAKADAVIAQNQEIAATIKTVRSDLAVYSPLSVENLLESRKTVWLVTSEKQTRVPLDFPGDGWSCARPHEFYLPYHLLREGTFSFEIARCERQSVVPNSAPPS